MGHIVYVQLPWLRKGVVGYQLLASRCLSPSVLSLMDEMGPSCPIVCAICMARDYGTSVCLRLESAVVFSGKSAFKLKGKKSVFASNSMSGRSNDLFLLSHPAHRLCNFSWTET